MYWISTFCVVLWRFHRWLSHPCFDASNLGMCVFSAWIHVLFSYLALSKSTNDCTIRSFLRLRLCVLLQSLLSVMKRPEARHLCLSISLPSFCFTQSLYLYFKLLCIHVKHDVSFFFDFFCFWIFHANSYALTPFMRNHFRAFWVVLTFSFPSLFKRSLTAQAHGSRGSERIQRKAKKREEKCARERER